MAAVSSRYARALAEVVLDKKLILAEFASRCKVLWRWWIPVLTCETSGTILSVPAGQKRKLLDAIAKRLVLDPMVRNFLRVLIDHHRISSIGTIARQLRKNWIAG